MPDTDIVDPATGKKWRLSGPTVPSESEVAHVIRALKPGLVPSHDQNARIGAPTQTSPLSIVGAPRGAAAAALGGLIDQPGHVGNAISEVKRELMRIGGGGRPTEPSESLAARGVKIGPTAGIIADSLIDPLNVATAGDDAMIGGVKGAMEHTPELVSSTRHLYKRLLSDVLPIMNKPETPAMIMKYIDQAGASVAAHVSGFASWLSAQGSKALSRAQVIARLMREPEFRSILMEHAHPLIRPAVIGGDYEDRRAREGDIEEPSGMEKLILSLAPFAATATGTMQEPDIFGDASEMIDDVTELPDKK